MPPVPQSRDVGWRRRHWAGEIAGESRPGGAVSGFWVRPPVYCPYFRCAVERLDFVGLPAALRGLGCLLSFGLRVCLLVTGCVSVPLWAD